MNKSDRLIVLIAPNVSEQMGGEAIKALQIFCEFKKLNKNTIQITHERCKNEISERLKLTDVYYITDTWIARFLWRSKFLRRLVDVWFSAKAIQLADRIASLKGMANRSTVVHQTEPNSPVTIRQFSKRCFNVIGPINGNIHYPALFRSEETFSDLVRRKSHFPLQRVGAFLLPHTKRADLVLAAGGDRTIKSLLAAGFRRDVINETIDCGVADETLDQARITHEGQNFRFVHYGRLVIWKGTFLAIEALTKSDERIILDIIGTGAELESCRRLTKKLKLETRVNFLGWFRSHQELFGLLGKYRGMVAPTFQDSNGIAVQEAMAIGLPPICLKWGGPQLLIEDRKSGFLIEPLSKSHVVSKIAEAFNALSGNPELAEKMSVAGRERAEQWRWSRVAREWLSVTHHANAS